MAVATTQPAPSLPSTSRPDDLLAGLLSDLEQLDVHAGVLTDYLAGEPDVRVQAWRDGGDVLVELLWCGADTPAANRLDAVRVRGEQRQVWRGPRCRCFPADAVRFLSALLLLDDRRLGQHYLLLG
jgi:hypothetical protein